MYYGSYIKVGVHGYPQDEPIVKMGYRSRILVSIENINSPSGNILNGKEYEFFMPYIPTSQARYMSDIDIHDTIKVYDGTSLKDTTFIQ
ncbi:MAG: hypothetical protein CSB13_01310 [Chloroflexi bacterium]|nr:MAG: hypothetical protein CSB13_01310 [Chloroflexota bacterium]